MLCYNVLQDSQQRIVVMKKESERLSQEVNQMDTNKLGKLNLLLNTNLKDPSQPPPFSVTSILLI